MKSLTVRQPWASAFFLPEGAKDIENRSRPTDYRGTVAILAGLQFDTKNAHRAPIELPKGGVIGCYLGVVDIVGCHRAMPDCACGPWAFEPEDDTPLYHWVIANPQRLTAVVNATGHLGLRDVAAGPLTRIISQHPETSR